MGFLEENALVADVDRYDESADAVVLMTVHSAKGLEFPIVIIPGFEDGIFPSMQTVVGTSEDMEEERRLAYVALTRAKEQIFIMHTKHRLLYGQTQANPLSRFVTEIPEQYTEREQQDFGGGMFGSMQGTRIYYSEKNTANTSRRDQQIPARSVTTREYANKGMSEQTTIGKPLFERSQNAGREVFKPGDRVKHLTFGEGEVLSVRPMGADTLYEVMFDRVGTKKLMATYAKLKKI
jgi:DNA helicase-2/ATP-dependent DNA helicase PcrA